MRTLVPTAYIPWAALGGSILLGAGAQIALKYATNVRQDTRSAFATKLLWFSFWFGSFLVATWLWIVALGRLDISYAYPMLGLGYVLVTILASVLLKEEISKTHWVAVIIIAAGAACVAGSA